MGNLFNTSGSQYDNDGNLLINPVTSMESGVCTITGNKSQGNLSICYDRGYNPGCFWYLQLSSWETRVSGIKWDLKRKTAFDNIIAVVKIDDGYATLEGSNDDSTWTILDTSPTVGTTAETHTLLASNVNYRYYRLTGTRTGGTYSDHALVSIKGILKK